MLTSLAFMLTGSLLGAREARHRETGVFPPLLQARLERDLSNKKIYQEEEMPESGAGSEFNRKLREEARRKKYGIVLKEFRPEDQPWLLRVNGKSGRK